MPGFWNVFLFNRPIGGERQDAMTVWYSDKDGFYSDMSFYNLIQKTNTPAKSLLLQVRDCQREDPNSKFSLEKEDFIRVAAVFTTKKVVSHKGSFFGCFFSLV